jgi:hypothetical protein
MFGATIGLEIGNGSDPISRGLLETSDRAFHGRDLVKR